MLFSHKCKMCVYHRSDCDRLQPDSRCHVEKQVGSADKARGRQINPFFHTVASARRFYIGLKRLVLLAANIKWACVCVWGGCCFYSRMNFKNFNPKITFSLNCFITFLQWYLNNIFNKSMCLSERYSLLPRFLPSLIPCFLASTVDIRCLCVSAPPADLTFSSVFSWFPFRMVLFYPYINCAWQ